MAVGINQGKAFAVIARASWSEAATRRRRDRGEAFERTRSLAPHRDAALDWLASAQDVSLDGGVSYGYSLRGGWLPSYPETSGYIVPTLLGAADALNRPVLADRAIRIASWLLTIQNPDGSFANPRYGPGGIVFDTGQDLFGLVAAYRHTGDVTFLDSARRAGQWLVDIADDEGVWTRSEHRNNPHVYNTRTAWALLELNTLDPRPAWVQTARTNLEWALANQVSTGFFMNNAFDLGDDPYTHNISYAVCGLQESGWLLGEDRYVAAARRCSDAVLDRMEGDGFISGQISPTGKADRNYSCLTGQAQMSVVWATQAEREADPVLREASRRSVDYVAARQVLEGTSPTVGAIGGSHPLWGRYAPLSYPNWAAKFFIDACLLHREKEGQS